MKSPTHYIAFSGGQVLKSNAPWLVYGWLAPDGAFVALDGRKFPGDLAVPINPADASGGASGAAGR
ncbi:hypothetical protein [Thiobacillus sedimenti]|uniref:Uncharacterized protein n=1 Tax=Thiobacillus sedimenti TaxID=3110231 RepID=A0ABZ1CF21_9PROT|nr:hypothetical protein [Thiobacillus sp. SCUT-2]WRS37959.1 hypothetical protein VA613_07975 [Thiobacillus sp. SCUT-2]